MDEILTEKLKKYKKHKKLAESVDLYQKYKNVSILKAESCAYCGNSLSFAKWQNKETAELRYTLENANFCKNRWCPMCAWRKTKKVADEIKSILGQIEAKQEVKYLFLTLTIKNANLTDLKATTKHLSESFKRLVETKRFKDSVLGFVRAVEFMGDNTKKGEAHPHFHTILIVPKSYAKNKTYIPQKEWVEMWRKALRADYDPVVDIRAIKEKNEKWKDSDSAVFETIKYSVKPQELSKMSESDFLILDSQTKNIRQYNKGGLMRKYKPIPDEKIDEDLWEQMKTEYFNFVNGEYKKCATKKEADQKNHIKQKQKVSDSQN